MSERESLTPSRRRFGVHVSLSSTDRYDVRGSFWWFCLRWRWALKHRPFFACECSDGKVRWFNAHQIAWAGQL